MNQIKGGGVRGGMMYCGLLNRSNILEYNLLTFPSLLLVCNIYVRWYLRSCAGCYGYGSLVPHQVGWASNRMQ